MAINKNTNPSDDWKNSWKNSWKNPAYQNNENGGYRYERESNKSKFDMFKESQKNQKSEHVNIRREANKSFFKILLPAVVTLGVVLYVFLKIWGIV